MKDINKGTENKKVVQMQYYSSPCGGLILGSLEGKLCLCDWQGKERREVIDKRLLKALDATYEEAPSAVMMEAVRQLDEYFTGHRRVFDMPLLFGGTDFQKRVWTALVDIPFGKTCSYADLSLRLGNLKAIRAVASANGANPISIFVPCHRVIGSNHTLVGYGGGLPAKKFLLDLESPHPVLF